MEKTNEPVTMEITLDEKQKKIEDTKENRAKCTFFSICIAEFINYISSVFHTE